MPGTASPSRRSNPHWLAAGIGVALLVVWLAVMALAIRDAALAPDATGRMFVVFPPGLDDTAMVNRIAAAGGQPVRQTWIDSVWVVAGDRPGLAGALKDQGALGAYGELPVGMQLAGCFAWADAKVGQIFTLTP
ncbi:hypothetical protein [Rhodoligotrophos defluvii]|uniref:hypothetical protein n=1 Tax=Rhodoligotrophos defluvii TaxID=2561934 RepID=UPI0010C9E6F1|nr:hypothetical protein [Rhodoligotrophos defluvii]